MCLTLKSLVIKDFHTGDPIDLLISRRTNVAEPYFTSIPIEERLEVRYLISDMYNPYIAYVEKYFPNATPVVDAFQSYIAPHYRIVSLDTLSTWPAASSGVIFPVASSSSA